MLFCPIENVCPRDNFETELVRLAVCPLVPSIENGLSEPRLAYHQTDVETGFGFVCQNDQIILADIPRVS